jgi:two-component system sensor histidine kinase/response regulator
MTAHAMKGDRERCLAAGMDAYIAKPIQFDELLEVTESFVDFAPVLEESPEEAWDPELALARVGGDQLLLADVARIFCEQSPKLLSAVQAAIAKQNLVDLRRAAHSLRSAIVTFSALDASDAAAKLEAFSRPEEFEHASSYYQELEASVKKLQCSLESFAGGPVPAVVPSSEQSR